MPAAQGLSSGITDLALRAAVADSRSWRGVLRRLGLTPSGHSGPLRQRCEATGIDYSHFRTRTWSDEQLVQALATAVSWGELAHVLGYASDCGSTRATIRKHACRLGLQLDALDTVADAVPAEPFAGPADFSHLRDAGAYVVAGVCAMQGSKVAWPLEPAVYDLLIDTGRDVHRVQVKTTTWRLNGTWACKITRRQSGQKAWYTKRDIDFFGLVDGDLQVYMIPVEVVAGIGTVILRHYERYRIARPPGPVVTPEGAQAHAPG